MAAESEDKRAEDKRQKAYSNRRAIMDFGMGLIYTAMGLFFLFSDKLGIELDFPAKPFSTTFLQGFVCYMVGSEYTGAIRKTISGNPEMHQLNPITWYC